MQRFYCTVCKKVKRVQHLPANVTNASSEQPQDRVGECNRHNGNYTRAERLQIARKTGSR